MDADILAADALALERINAQIYRDDLEDLKAHRAAVREHQATIRAQYAAFIEWTKAEYAALPEPEAAKRLELALTLADKYFTTSTATLPESVQADAEKDAARFKAALEAAVAAVG